MCGFSDRIQKNEKKRTVAHWEGATLYITLFISRLSVGSNSLVTILNKNLLQSRAFVGNNNAPGNKTVSFNKLKPKLRLLKYDLWQSDSRICVYTGFNALYD